MAWILDEYSKFHGYSPAVVTGKPTVSIHANTKSYKLMSISSFSIFGVKLG